MKSIRISWIAALSVSAGSLAAGYGLNDSWGWSLLFAGLAALFWLGRRTRLEYFYHLALAGLIIAAGTGILRQLLPLAMLVAVVAALVAWDLERFERALGRVEPDENTTLLLRRHLQWLGLASVGGLLLPALAIEVELRLSFWLALALTLVLAVSLSRVVVFLKGERGS